MTRRLARAPFRVAGPPRPRSCFSPPGCSPGAITPVSGRPLSLRPSVTAVQSFVVLHDLETLKLADQSFCRTSLTSHASELCVRFRCCPPSVPRMDGQPVGARRGTRGDLGQGRELLSPRSSTTNILSSSFQLTHIWGEIISDDAESLFLLQRSPTDADIRQRGLPTTRPVAFWWRFPRSLLSSTFNWNYPLRNICQLFFVPFTFVGMDFISAPGSAGGFPTLVLEGALVPFTGEWNLEAKMSAPCGLIASVCPAPVRLLGRQHGEARACVQPLPLPQSVAVLFSNLSSFCLLSVKNINYFRHKVGIKMMKPLEEHMSKSL